MPYWFNADASTAHADITTVHVDRDCHHLASATRVSGVLDVPADASVCGSCGDPDDADE
jgi:hypothetical protein